MANAFSLPSEAAEKQPAANAKPLPLLSTYFACHIDNELEHK